MTQHAHSEPLHIDTQQRLHFNVGTRFTNLSPIGYGANGLVFAATDRDCDKKVAIKKISFHNKASCKYALREVKILRRLDHENIVSVYDVLGEGGRPLQMGRTPDLRAVYIIQELLDTDLNVLIQQKQLQACHMQWFVYQLLRALKYIHSANVLHRDLKPSNLLVNCEDLTLKVTDFGLARILDPVYNHSGYLTENVGTHCYKSPELILTPHSYTHTTDMWSAGCILAEMLLGHPLFPGLSDLQQLHLILDTVQLTDLDWTYITQILSNKALKNHPLKTVVPLDDKLGAVDLRAYDLLTKLLRFRPDERWDAEEALSHPYFSGVSLYRNEPWAAHPLCIEHEVDDLSPSSLKTLILDESVQPPESCGQESGQSACTQDSKPLTNPLVVNPNITDPQEMVSPQEEKSPKHKVNEPVPENAEKIIHHKCVAKSTKDIKRLSNSRNEFEKLNDTIYRTSFSSSESLSDTCSETDKCNDLLKRKIVSPVISDVHKIDNKYMCLDVKEDYCMMDSSEQTYSGNFDNKFMKIVDETNEVGANKSRKMIDECKGVAIDGKNGSQKEAMKLEESCKEWKKRAKESFKLHGIDISEKDEAEISPRKLEEDMQVAQRVQTGTGSHLAVKTDTLKYLSGKWMENSQESSLSIEGVSQEVLKLNHKNKNESVGLCMEISDLETPAYSEHQEYAGQLCTEKAWHEYVTDIENYKEYSSPSPKCLSPDGAEQAISAAAGKNTHTGRTAVHSDYRDMSATHETSVCETSLACASWEPAPDVRLPMASHSHWWDKNDPSRGLAHENSSSDSSDCDNTSWDKSKNAQSARRVWHNPSLHSSDCNKVICEKWQEKGLSELMNNCSINDSGDHILSNMAPMGEARITSRDIKSHKTKINLQSHITVPVQHNKRQESRPPVPGIEPDGIACADEDPYLLPHTSLTHHHTNQQLKAMRDRYYDDRHLAEIRMHECINARLKLEEQGHLDQACGLGPKAPVVPAFGTTAIPPNAPVFYEWLHSGNDCPESPPSRRQHRNSTTHRHAESMGTPEELGLTASDVDHDALNSRSPSHGAKPKSYKDLSKRAK